jgi:hypothetical protein
MLVIGGLAVYRATKVLGQSLCLVEILGFDSIFEALPASRQQAKMSLHRALFTALTFGSFCSAAYDVFDYVNLLIGTVNGGLCFCPRPNSGIERANHA